MKIYIVKKILPVFLTFLVLVFVSAIFAKTFAQNSQDLSIPPTSEGPGFFLPDSPFFFLDELKQNIRLAFSVTPSQKAKIYSSIAGERIAELRFELAKDDITASEVDVKGIRLNTVYAVKEVANAKMWGQDVSDIAKDINLKIKEHQLILDVLQTKATGELQAEVVIAQAALAQAKSEIEAYLPKDEQNNEIQDDLRREALQNANMMVSSAVYLSNSLSSLQKQTAIVSTNSSLEKTRNQATLQKQDLSGALQAQALINTKDVIQKAQDIINTLNIA